MLLGHLATDDAGRALSTVDEGLPRCEEQKRTAAPPPRSLPSPPLSSPLFSSLLHRIYSVKKCLPRYTATKLTLSLDVDVRTLTWLCRRGSCRRRLPCRASDLPSWLDTPRLPAVKVGWIWSCAHDNADRVSFESPDFMIMLCSTVRETDREERRGEERRERERRNMISIVTLCLLDVGDN